VKQFVAQVLEGSITVARDTEAMINARIAQIDHLLSLQINEIVHHPEFQRLESSWRGLKYLMSQSETGTGLKIKVLNVSKKELLRDLQRRPSSTRARCSRRCTRRSTACSAAPRSARSSATTTSTRAARTSSSGEGVERRGGGARAVPHRRVAHALQPRQLLAARLAARPRQGVRHHRVREVEGVPPDRRRTLRGARRAAHAPPRAVRRGTVPVDAFNYEERVDGTDHDAYLWGNAAYALAANVNKAFALYGWCASIRGVESGGLVEGLPVHNFRTETATSR
jgi:type VI secretion system protein ImpC